MATTEATSVTFLAAKHHRLSPGSATATVMATLSAQPEMRCPTVGRQYAFTSVASHPYNWDSPGVDDASK